MTKKIKPAILIFVQLLFLQGIWGQNSSDMSDLLRQRFIKYCKSVPREEIFIHTDREEYISGENLWFNVYLLDRQSFRQSSGSSIVYLELLNSKNRPVVQKRILLNKGLGPGQLILPDTLSTGTYTIRAYTSWMKNFLPDNCFTKNILVFNALNSDPSKAFGLKFNAHQPEDNNEIVPGKDSALTFRINDSDPDNLEIFIDAGKQFRDENKDIFYIFIQTHGNIDYVSSQKITGSSTEIKLPKTLLRHGINQITLFNSSGDPVSEKYIYTPGQSEGGIVIKSTDSCGLRDRVVLDVDLQNMIADSSSLSISVSPFTGKDYDDMTDYLIFGSEFGPGVHRSLSSVNDSVLLHLKSNWINWKEILSGKGVNIKYPAEKEDHFIMGNIVNSEGKTAVNREYVLMSTPGKAAEFQYAKTDSSGNFYFRLHIDERLKDLIIIPDNGENKINIESSFSDRFTGQMAYKVSSAETDKAFVSKLSTNHQVQKIYNISSPGIPEKAMIKPLTSVRFYGKPDIELILSDYINLPVMSEIIFELLPGVSLKKKKSGDEIQITYREGDVQYTTVPSLMIDGIKIRNAALISNLDPETVEKIDVIRGKYLVGRYCFPGIINVITKTGDFSNVTLPDYMIRIPYRVLDPVNSFVSPDYSTEQNKESRIPDYRNTLYWNPSVKTDKEGKARVEFWSSDNKADYVINIQGISKEGKAFSGQKILRVR